MYKTGVVPFLRASAEHRTVDQKTPPGLFWAKMRAQLTFEEKHPLRGGMSKSPTLIPGIRSPYETVGGIVHFGRMLDKIRVHAKGQLPPDWISAMGSPTGFDGRCCDFLKIKYAELHAETLKGGSDDSLFAWAVQHGRQPSENEIEIWNAFMTKRGWRDGLRPRLQMRLQESGLPIGAVETMFDFIDLDEGRPPRFS